MTHTSAPRPDPEPSQPGAGAAAKPPPAAPARLEPGGTLDPAPRVRDGWGKRRREKIAAEIARNRRGEYTVPTWVLTTLLVVIVGTWLGLIFFG